MDCKHKMDWYAKIVRITSQVASGGFQIGAGLKVAFILI